MTVRPARASDICPMVELLHSRMDDTISRERWLRLFTYGWLADKPDFGRVALLDGEIVGCVVAVYADRLIDGRTERFVNPCAWYLDRRARGQGLGLELMADVTSRADWHYIIPTSSGRTTGLLERVGFSVLDREKFVWRHAASAARTPLRLIRDPCELRDRMPAEVSRVRADHAGLPARRRRRVPRLVGYAQRFRRAVARCALRVRHGAPCAARAGCR